jgi:hypothetical protein
MSEALERLLEGRVLVGRYEIQEVIGRGGMSVVRRAMDRRLGRPVAVKLMSLPGGSGEERAHLRARFRREAAAAASIPPHPNVVQIYDYGTDPELDLDFIAMELLVGRDLKEALAHAPPGPEEAARILRDAARGVAAGHRVGIIHRDIKPANLFLVAGDEGEMARVLDFGIAKPVEGVPGADLTRVGQTAYSPAYASPEQLRGARPLTPASDVYQLGVIGYEVLAGEHPFPPEERERLRQGERLEVRARGRWNAVQPEVRRVVERALRADPEERFADAAELAAALTDALAAPPPPVEAPPVPGVRVEVGKTSSPGADALWPGQAALWRRFALLAAVVLAAVLLSRVVSRDPAEPGGTGPAPLAGGVAQETGAAAPEEESTGVPDELQTELRAAVVDLNQAWVEGDLRRHVRHYASRVNYYNTRRLARSGIRRDRQRDLRRYPERSIEIHDVRFERVDPERVRALTDKSWRLYGPERGGREGRGLQEYIFKQDDDDGKWYVVSEQLLEQTERRTPPP